MPEGDVGRVAVLGAGTMGHGIAQVCAVSGLGVVLFDVQSDALDVAQEKVRASVDKLIDKGKLDAAARAAAAGIERTADLSAAVSRADLIIEAVPEKIDLKRELFAQVSAAAPKDALLASNTSSLSIADIARGATDPGRVLGLHFFNPVPLMALVEIVRSAETTERSMTRAGVFVAHIGKEAIVVRDSPGFATSRLGVVIGAEAIRMLEAGVASASNIDRAMELGYGHPMGPLRLTDLVGLDVRLAILEHLHGELGEQFRPPELLRDMVRAGKLGKKSGQGFYEY